MSSYNFTDPLIKLCNIFKTPPSSTVNILNYHCCSDFRDASALIGRLVCHVSYLQQNSKAPEKFSLKLIIHLWLRE